MLGDFGGLIPRDLRRFVWPGLAKKLAKPTVLSFEGATALSHGQDSDCVRASSHEAPELKVASSDKFLNQTASTMRCFGLVAIQCRPK